MRFATGGRYRAAVPSTTRTILARCVSAGCLLFGAVVFVTLLVTGALPLVWAVPLLALTALVGYALLLGWGVLPVPDWMLRRAREELRRRGEWGAGAGEGHDVNGR